MSGVKTGFALFVAVISLRFTTAQFPTVCVGNATLPNSTCCPIPPGFEEPCGGPGRGRCVRVQLPEDLRNVPLLNQIDDRFNWPTNFFQNVCTCFGNFSGYMCQECWYGNTGINCTERIQTVRKEISTLTREERERFISLVVKSTSVQSDYMVLNTSQSADPTVNPQFLNVSEFHYLAYLHYYVSRKTLFGNDSICDDPDILPPDFAHEGPAFLVWHRLYSLMWERLFIKISGDETFSLPYWNWADAGGHCSVCTDELLGSSGPAGTLSNGSAFSDWKVLCHPPKTGCQICDPHQDFGPIIRKFGGDPSYRNLPSQESVDYAMSMTFYDLDPYSQRSPNSSFRNVLEGFGKAASSNDNSSLHNLVHNFLNGTMTHVVTASMDPIFIVHHTFIDKLFETWLLNNKATARQLPLVGAQPGHNRNSYLVPFFPLVTASEMFQKSSDFGYTYDDKGDVFEVSDDTGPWKKAVIVLSVLSSISVILLIISQAKRCYKKSKGK